MVNLEDIIGNGDMSDYLAYVERAKRLGLNEEVAKLEEEMFLKRSHVSNWLTQAVHTWDINRPILDKYIEDAKKIGLDDIVANVEGAICMREKRITEGLEFSIQQGLRSTYETWLKHALNMCMEEVINRSKLNYDTMVKSVKLTLLETATCGTKEEFLLITDKARDLGLVNEVKRSMGIVRKRVCDLISDVVTLATEGRGRESGDWTSLRERGQALGICEDVLVNILSETAGIEEHSTNIRENQDAKFEIQTGSNTVQDMVDTPVWSMMQNWTEIERVRRSWQKEMLDTRNNDQMEYESDGDEKHEIIEGPSDGMHEILDIPLILTRFIMEQKTGCNTEGLQTLTKLDLNNEGLTSLGEGIFLENFPRLKSLSCDMNRLTTLRRAFVGLEYSLEHISVRNNFITDISDLGVYNLESLHLDGNNICEITPSKNSLNKLKELGLSCNRITKLSMLGTLCPSLQVLDLGSNQLVTMGGRHGNALTRLKHLRVLDVGQNRLKGRSLWESLRNCPLLISLVASRNRLTELPTFSGSVLLRELWLNGNAIRRLSCQAWMPNLQRLYLQDNSIETLESLWGCPALEVLDLSFNAISDLSQLRQLSCFLHLRSLQLNDNPVSEQTDYVDTVLEAVPWLMELDNESVSESSKNRVVKRIFTNIMGKVGMQYISEKALRGELIISTCGKPDELQQIVIRCTTHQRLHWFNNMHRESVISAGGRCQERECTGTHLIPLKAFHTGTLNRYILWSAIFEATTLFDNTSRLLRFKPGEGILYEDMEAKQDVFTSMKMCIQQRERLLLANKDIQINEEYSQLEERRRTNSSAGYRRGIDDLELCLKQHIEFRKVCHVSKSERAALKIQTSLKNYLLQLRREKAVGKIHKAWKRWNIRRYVDIPLLVNIQAVWRGYSVRKKLKNALASSKYIDEDSFDYNAVYEDDFINSNVDSYTPELILGSSSTEDSSNIPIWSVDNLLHMYCDSRASDTSSNEVEVTEIKNVQMAQIAEDWGFKDEKTVKQFMKACKKGKKPIKVSKPIVEDPHKRFEIFKAKAASPNEHHIIEKLISREKNGIKTTEFGKPLDKDVVKPSVYLFGISTH